jgi:thioesterase domain-containing protein/acyl carrier protein
LQRLRLMVVGSEPFLKSDFDIYRSHFPDDCHLLAGLGASETGEIRLNRLDKTAQIETGTVPIGYPIRDMEILLQDEAGNPVASGEIGEIVVRSPYIASGYWKRPELNRQVFLPDPEGGDKRLFRTGDLGRFLPDGCLVHCGRSDFQVKIRGYRIELEEIESAVMATGLVKDIVVVSHASPDGNNRLVAYVVPMLNTGDLPNALRLALSDHLAAHMIPGLFMVVNALPHTPNGKVDRQALPAPAFATHPAITPIGNIPVETELAYIWGDILSINPPPGPDIDFFSLGGDSLHAARLFIEIEKRFGLRFPLAVLLENNTINKLAALIIHNYATQRKSLVVIRSKGTSEPLFIMPGGYGDVLYLRHLAKYVEEDRPIYGLQAASDINGRYDGINIEEVASVYLTEILRVQPGGSYYLAGHSFGGYIAMEMARQLLEQGRKVAFLGLWDTYPPGPRRQASLPDRILIHLSNLRRLGPRKALGYFRERWNSLVLQAAHLAPVRSFLKWINYKPKKAIIAARISRYGFHPDPFPGNLFLFKVRQRPWYVRWDPMENWHKYVQGDLVIREVQGRHGNILFEPYVQDLARQLNNCLRTGKAGQVEQESGGVSP